MAINSKEEYVRKRDSLAFYYDLQKDMEEIVKKLPRGLKKHGVDIQNGLWEYIEDLRDELDTYDRERVRRTAMMPIRKYHKAKKKGILKRAIDYV
jgi:hypothetical protein